MNAPEEPEPLSFVWDRMVILRTAHKMLDDLAMIYDVNNLLDTAAWLAGDALPGSATNLLTAPEEREQETDEQGA